MHRRRCAGLWVQSYVSRQEEVGMPTNGTENTADPAVSAPALASCPRTPVLSGLPFFPLQVEKEKGLLVAAKKQAAEAAEAARQAELALRGQAVRG